MLSERLTIGKKRFKVITPAPTVHDNTSFIEVASPSLHTDEGMYVSCMYICVWTLVEGGISQYIESLLKVCFQSLLEDGHLFL